VPSDIPYYEIQSNPQCSQNLLRYTHMYIQRRVIYLHSSCLHAPLQFSHHQIEARWAQGDTWLRRWEGSPWKGPQLELLQNCRKHQDILHHREACSKVHGTCVNCVYLLHVQRMSRNEAGHADPPILHPPVPMQLRGPAPNGT
jgi:hypothetical protein